MRPFSNVQSNLQKTRSSQHPTNLTIDNFANLEIADTYTHIKYKYANNEIVSFPFLLKRHSEIYGPDNKSTGFIAFGLHSMIDKCLQEQQICIDGTFSITPPPFLQTLIIGFLIGENNYMKLFPALYVLLTHKTEHLYNLIFNWLNVEYRIGDHNIPINWTRVMTDNESALRNSITAFKPPNCVLYNCLFHTTQAIKRIYEGENCKLKNFYNSNELFRNYVKRIYSIALVPLHSCQIAYELINDINNFDNQQLRNSLLENNKEQGFNNFKHSLVTNYCNQQKYASWNVYLADSHRTNNDMEGLNKYINDSLPVKPSTNFYSFTTNLQNFQKDYSTIMERYLLLGAEATFTARNGDQILKEDQIRLYKEQLENGAITLSEYINNIKDKI